jgi:1-aminocyclopropane-1-carboxylate synthase
MVTNSLQDFTYGDGLCGTTRLFGALAKFFNEWFKPIKPVEQSHIITGSGASCILNQLFRAITDAGDGVLIAGPYYPGFDNDLLIMDNAVPIPVNVPLKDMFQLREVEHLEQALLRSDVPVKAVILCNPHNPLGRCYGRETIIAYAKLCQKYNLHLISDEIYALSVFPTKDVPEPETFTSVLSINFGNLDVETSRIHVVYGMSKDFNANGFRVGVLISQDNPVLLDAIMVTSFFMLVSSPANILWSSILEDRDFLLSFVSANQGHLATAFQHMSEWLRFHHIAYIPSNAGHFMMINLQSVIRDVTKYQTLLKINDDMDMWERERQLGKHLARAKVFITPGEACHFNEPGWYRISFSVQRPFLQVALKRVEAAMEWKPWPGLDVERGPATEANSLLGVPQGPCTRDGDQVDGISRVMQQVL